MVGVPENGIIEGRLRAPSQEDDVPTYAYACTACGHRFEVQQSFTDAALSECPECTGRLRKLFNNVGIVFKGSGFYRTDSRSGTSSTPSSDASSTSSSESSSESSSGAAAAPAASESSSSTSTTTAAPAGASKAGTAKAGASKAPAA